MLIPRAQTAVEANLGIFCSMDNTVIEYIKIHLETYDLIPKQWNRIASLEMCKYFYLLLERLINVVQLQNN